MRRSWTSLLTAAALLAIAAPAHADGSAATWAAFDPGDDWAAQVLNSLFPTLNTGSALTGIGAETTVIGQMIGQLSGFMLALAAAFMAYTTIIQIHRAAESGRVLGGTTSSWAPVRICFALGMMFPLPSGFSSGQAAVLQVSMWGIGMARTVYTQAIKAVGPDAMPIAIPMIPGTKTIVSGLIEDELCMALVNEASNTVNSQPAVPAPTATTGSQSGDSAIGGTYLTYSYSLAAGNETGAPACGSVTLHQTDPNATNIAGVSADMSSQQRSALDSVISSNIRPDAQTVAHNLWMNRDSNALNQLTSTMTGAVQAYTLALTNAAKTVTDSLRSALSSTAAARGGELGLSASQTKLDALGWTSAGSYYVEIARLNGQTLSLMSSTPTVVPPSYQGFGRGLSNDLAPLIKGVLDYQAKLAVYVATTDGMDAPGGETRLFNGATPGGDGTSTISSVFRGLHLNERVLNGLVTAMSPTTGTGWTDPFRALINLGQTMTLISLGALGLAAILASNVGTMGTMAGNLLHGNITGAVAAGTGHLVMTFLGTPIFYGLMAMLIPGLTISYILPMVPFAIWIAGVAGWLILVIEAMIAVPLWMFAHLTFQGDGLHGRGLDGYGLLFNILFRPTLMLFGLFMGYFVFSSMSWLMLQGFSIAAGFALSNGWFVTNMIGVIVLINMFVLMEITLALLSFRLISLVPHHVIKMIGFAPANRVDMDRFSADVGTAGMGATMQKISGAQREMLNASAAAQTRIGQAGQGALKGAGAQRMIGHDATLNASSDVSGPAEPREG